MQDNNKKYILFGLGNPGDEYENTRHNAGRLFVEFLEKYKEKNNNLKNLANLNLLTADNKTFMNESGKFIKYYIKQDNLDSLIVAYDDLDIALGEYKISFDKSSGGHNGVQSIIDNLGSQKFTRIRVGIAKKSIFGNMKRVKGEDMGDFVLKEFGKSEKEKLEEVFGKIVEEYLLAQLV